MRTEKLLRLVAQSIQRNRRDFALSSVGIVIGVATLLFFTALGAGIKETVLERVFIIRQLELEAKSVGIGLFGGTKLDDAMVERLRARPGVKAVFPKMRLTFPTGAVGGAELIGQDLRAEFIGDGIPEALVEGEISGPLEFRDWDAPIACGAEQPCPQGFSCGSDQLCAANTCQPDAPQRDLASCPRPAYCDAATSRCVMPIPVVIHPQLLEIYNGSMRTAFAGAGGAVSKLPRLSPQLITGLEFTLTLGRSFFVGRAASGKNIERRVRIVGFSERAIHLGATMPIGYVQRLNQELGSGKDEGKRYHSIVVEAHTNDAVAQIARYATEDLGLSLSDRYENAQRAGLLILLITLVFNLISAIILLIAAVNIMHTFLMILLERRRELGLMRALGATRGDIRALVLGEATALGLLGGGAGVVMGVGAMKIADMIFNSSVQNFPFKPDSLFVIEAWMVASAMAVAVVFCWLGALFPAIRAGRIDPARALTGHL
jgi:ABC-type lipoprotein release transport system permease subunit